ncbi:MAG: four helix bundle protein [Lentisphaeria bacterium]|nr:four helix bundle protein [Lentisphaeria bacterium]
MNHGSFNLADRLVDFAVAVIALSRALPNTEVGRHVASQLLRSGTSPAPNYAEAQSAESRADFIHKLKISLKELRETDIWLRIILKTDLMPDEIEISSLRDEANELISILVASVGTARKNSR